MNTDPPEAILANDAEYRDPPHAERGEVLRDRAARAGRDFRRHHADSRNAGFARCLRRARVIRTPAIEADVADN